MSIIPLWISPEEQFPSILLCFTNIPTYSDVYIAFQHRFERTNLFLEQNHIPLDFKHQIDSSKGRIIYSVRNGIIVDFCFYRHCLPSQTFRLNISRFIEVKEIIRYFSQYVFGCSDRSITIYDEFRRLHLNERICRSHYDCTIEFPKDFSFPQTFICHFPNGMIEFSFYFSAEATILDAIEIFSKIWNISPSFISISREFDSSMKLNDCLSKFSKDCRFCVSIQIPILFLRVFDSLFSFPLTEYETKIEVLGNELKKQFPDCSSLKFEFEGHSVESDLTNFVTSEQNPIIVVGLRDFTFEIEGKQRFFRLPMKWTIEDISAHFSKIFSRNVLEIVRCETSMAEMSVIFDVPRICVIQTLNGSRLMIDISELPTNPIIDDIRILLPFDSCGLSFVIGYEPLRILFGEELLIPIISQLIDSDLISSHLILSETEGVLNLLINDSVFKVFVRFGTKASELRELCRLRFCFENDDFQLFCEGKYVSDDLIVAQPGILRDLEIRVNGTVQQMIHLVPLVFGECLKDLVLPLEATVTDLRLTSFPDFDCTFYQHRQPIFKEDSVRIGFHPLDFTPIEYRIVSKSVIPIEKAEIEDEITDVMLNVITLPGYFENGLIDLISQTITDSF
jgi:hypothetical protein